MNEFMASSLWPNEWPMSAISKALATIHLND